METKSPQETESGANPKAEEPPDNRRKATDYHLFKSNKEPVASLRADYNLHVQNNYPGITGTTFHVDTRELSFFGLIALRDFLEERGYTLPELEEPIPIALANGLMHDVGVIQTYQNAISVINPFKPAEESLNDLETRLKGRSLEEVKLFLPLRGFSIVRKPDTQIDEILFNYRTADVDCIVKQSTHPDRQNTPTYTLKRGNTSINISAQLCNGVSRLLISGENQAAIHNIYLFNQMIGYIPIIKRK